MSKWVHKAVPGKSYTIDLRKIWPSRKSLTKLSEKKVWYHFVSDNPNEIISWLAFNKDDELIFYARRNSLTQIYKVVDSLKYKGDSDFFIKTNLENFSTFFELKVLSKLEGI